MQLCPDLPPSKIVTTGDILAERDAFKFAYRGCAAKVSALNTWRASHVKD